jgi:TPR repeat protein
VTNTSINASHAARHDDTAIDTLIWQEIADSNCPDDFRAYLRHKPEGALHLDDALEHLIRLDDADADGDARYDRAIDAIHQLAEQGNPTAQFHMGKLLTQGIGVPKDALQGHKWYRLAILQNEAQPHQSRHCLRSG